MMTETFAIGNRVARRDDFFRDWDYGTVTDVFTQDGETWLMVAYPDGDECAHRAVYFKMDDTEQEQE